MVKRSFQNICNLLHNQYIVASKMKETFGSEKMITKIDKQIIGVLKTMHSIPEFRTYFVNDLLKRAKNFIEDSRLKVHKINEVRNSNMISKQLLDPSNLIFFSR